MPIDFSCNGCGQVYRVKEEFAGKTTRCKKCGASMTVPTPAPELPEPVDELGSLLDEELGSAGSRPTEQPAAAANVLCPTCKAPLPPGVLVCGQCGLDLMSGTPKGAAIASAPTAAKSQSSSGGGGLLGPSLARGIVISGVGAVLGAVVWALVAVLTDRQFGWIAIAVGGAAGGGMAAGCNEKIQGMIPGAIACAMSLGGIVLGKILIVVWVLLPLVTGNLEDFQFKREALAGQMANDALKQQGIVPHEADEATVEREMQAAMKALEGVSDEEIDQRFEAMVEKIQIEAEQEAAKQQLAEAQKANPQPQAGAEAQADEPQPLGGDAQFVELPLDEVEEPPSLLGAFFSAMFGPIDGLFILLAFAAAYKLGSGAVNST